MNKKINPNIDTTKVVNILGEDFTHPVNNEPWTIKEGQEKVCPIYVAKLIAKHMSDKILQEQKNIRYALPDNPVRKQIIAKILPELEEEGVIETKNEDEFKQMVMEQLKEQKKMISDLKIENKEENISKDEPDKDKLINDLLQRIEKLEGKGESKEEKLEECPVCHKEFKNLGSHMKVHEK